MNLTRDEIMNMPAGREMDSLIAEHIFGHVVKWRKTPTTKYHDGLNFSTRISDAWQVAEKLKGYHNINIFRVDEDEVWHVSVRVAGDQFYLETIGKTAAIAICRAALLAVLYK